MQKFLCLLVIFSSSFIFNATAQTGQTLKFSSVTDTKVLLDNLSITGPFTIEAWVNPNQKTDFSTIIDTKLAGISSGGMFFSINNYGTSDGKLYLETQGTGCSSDQSVTWGVWQHIAVTYDGTDVNFYINGVSVSTPSTNIILGPNSDNCYLGDVPDYLGNANYDGLMDELRIWDHARTAGELIATMPCQLSGTETGLMAYYQFNQGIADGDNTGLTSLGDFSGNNHTGTLQNFSLNGTGTNFTAPSAVTEILTLQAFLQCAPFSVTVGSNTYSVSGNYTDVLTAANGCDSIIETALSLLQGGNSEQYITVCDGEIVMVGTHIYNTTGTFTDLFPVAGNCDSTVTTYLTVLDPILTVHNFSGCEGFSVTEGTNTYNTTGSFNDVYSAANGCDSSVITNLSILLNSNTDQNFTLCNGDSITVGTHVYNSTGIYSDILLAANGCDSIVITHLDYSLPDTTVTVSGATLSVPAGAVSYQWVLCDGNNTPVPNETSSSFTATVNGDYAVEVSVGSCTTLSSCYTVSGLSLNAIKENRFEIYPNPATKEFKVESLKFKVGDVLIVTDLLGRKIIVEEIKSNITTVDVTNIISGVYIVAIQLKNGEQVKRKLIVE